MRRLAAAVVASTLIGASAWWSPIGAVEFNQSLPAVASGARPGPDVLYAPPPPAPQLENRNAAFRAQPLLVAATEAYVDGEYLYQDYIYDDYGADTGHVDGATTDSSGDMEYPTNRQRYGGNAADLLEFRIAATPNEVAYRITLNTMLAADSAIIAIAFDTDKDAGTGTTVLPRDPGAPFPGTDEAITAWGTGAEHTKVLPVAPGTTTSAARPVTTPVDVEADLDANQMTIFVPRSVSDPKGVWRATVAVGLRDHATGGWLRPQQGAPSAEKPGGATPRAPDASGIFNLAFRFDEAPAGLTPPDAKQATALVDKAPTRYARDIDFGALSTRLRKSTVPATGTMVRIFASALLLGEGRDHSARPEYLGQLQPYSLYVPSKYTASKPAGLTLNLHSLGEYYYQYNASLGVQQMGEQRANLVATSAGRGEDGWYQDEAEYDVFEMWADVARHYSLDPERVAISGYSMGGYATYRLATLYPDLFGKAFTVVGPPCEAIWLPPTQSCTRPQSQTNIWLENARNVPFLNVSGAADELVPIVGPRAQNLGAPETGIRGLDQLGYRFRWVVYDTADHFALAALGYDIPHAVPWLADARVDRSPRHVTFAYLPASDNAKLGLVHDHAYWVSEVRLANASAPMAKGVVDAFSHTHGMGDPPSTQSQATGTAPMPYTEVNRTWGEAPRIAKANKLTIRLDNIAGAQFDLTRAGIDGARPIAVAVESSAPALLRMVAGGAALDLEVATGKRDYVVDFKGGNAELTRDDRGTLPATGGWSAAVGIVLLVGFLTIRRLTA